MCTLVLVDVVAVSISLAHCSAVEVDNYSIVIRFEWGNSHVCVCVLRLHDSNLGRRFYHSHSNLCKSAFLADTDFHIKVKVTQYTHTQPCIRFPSCDATYCNCLLLMNN